MNAAKKDKGLKKNSSKKKKVSSIPVHRLAYLVILLDFFFVPHLCSFLFGLHAHVYTID